MKRYGTVVWRDEVSRDCIAQLYQSAEGSTLVSFDLDAVSQAEAPGVSAPSPAGISAELWLEAAYLAGRSPAVSSMDVVELNPGSIEMDRRHVSRLLQCGKCYEGWATETEPAPCAAWVRDAL